MGKKPLTLLQKIKKINRIPIYIRSNSIPYHIERQLIRLQKEAEKKKWQEKLKMGVKGLSRILLFSKKLKEKRQQKFFSDLNFTLAFKEKHTKLNFFNFVNEFTKNKLRNYKISLRKKVEHFLLNLKK